MQGLEDWKAGRLTALMAEDGWLNLTDRVEIGLGEQRVGRGPGNDLVLSVGPEHLGVLMLTDGRARLVTPGGVPQEFVLAPGGFPQLRVPPLLLEIHTVDGVPALRVRDLTAPRRADLRGAARAGAGRHHQAQDRPDRRRLLLRHQAEVDPR